MPPSFPHVFPLWGRLVKVETTQPSRVNLNGPPSPDRALLRNVLASNWTRISRHHDHPSRKRPHAEGKDMINPRYYYSRSPIKLDEAKAVAQAISEISSSEEEDLTVQAAKVLELHQLNKHIARIADALDRIAPK
jgi:hypothetical protein